MPNNPTLAEKIAALEAENKQLKAQLEQQNVQGNESYPNSIATSNYNGNLNYFLSDLPFFAWIRDKEHKFIYVNKHSYINYAESKDIIGLSVFDLFPEDLALKYAASDKRVIETDQREEYFDKRADKYYRLYKFPVHNANKEVVAVGGFEMDITRQVLSEINLRKERKLFNSLLDYFPYTIYFKDVDCKFIRINKAQAELLGVEDPNDAIGKTDFDFFTAVHSTDAYNDEQKIIKSGEPLIEKIEKVRNAEGKFRWVSTTKVPIFNEEGEAEGLVGLTVDITDRRNAEINLEKALIRAEEADKLKSAFLANMSHDIRTPMNGIVGFADLLRSSRITREQHDKYVQQIIKSGNTLLELIDDIIDISKIEAGQLKIEKRPIKLNGILDEIYEMFSSNPEYARKQQIRFQLHKGVEGDDVKIITDPTRFKQIIHNLISNAFKFTHEGEISLGYKKKKKELEFFVKDSGVGIPEEFHEVIFERFGQVAETKRINKKGTGLGLAITSSLVEYLGGAIWVKSEPGIGSTFYFTLPYIRSSEQTDDEVEVSELNLDDLNNKCVLIAEDEESNYLYLEGILDGTGVKLLHAKNGKEAIAMVASHDEPIDAVLMDIRMPMVNGYEATRAIKQIDKNLPVIAQTAFVMEDDKNKCFEAGCEYYLSKPIKKEHLLEILRNAIVNRRKS